MDVNATDNGSGLEGKVKIDVELHFGQEERELIEGLESAVLSGGDLILSDVVGSLKAIGYPLEGTMVSYFSDTENFLVHCGNDPLPSSAVMARTDYETKGRIKLKFRPGMKPSYNAQGSSSSVTGAAQNPVGATVGVGNVAAKQAPSRRTKERKIGFIIEKVALWRKLYNGVKGTDGELVRYSLEDAAQRVGISKKSLDDYLLQLRFGRKFGFNFNDHRNSKVGVLRSFVKKNKTALKAKEKTDQDSGTGAPGNRVSTTGGAHGQLAAGEDEEDEFQDLGFEGNDYVDGEGELAA